MKILIDIGHPAHVHLFRNCYKILESKGHQVFVTVRDIPIAKRLLDNYKMPYYDLGKKNDTIIGKVFTILKQDFTLLKFVRRNSIDISISSGIALSHVALVSKMETIICDDDDDIVEPLMVRFGHSIAKTILSPSSIVRKASTNVSYAGTHELAYLHPSVFAADPNILADAGLNVGERFFILRFVALKGHHDIGQKGINLEQKRRIINLLKGYGRVIITSENQIEDEFAEYQLSVSPEKIHSLLYFANMFLGDSQTMTSEAAILGTPALKCNTFAGNLSVPNELELKYGLCYSYNPDDFEKFYNHIITLLTTENLKEEWLVKRSKFLDETINVTDFFVWFVENYPKSRQIMKENPDYQYNFK